MSGRPIAAGLLAALLPLCEAQGAATPPDATRAVAAAPAPTVPRVAAAQARNLSGIWLLAAPPTSRRETVKPEFAARFPSSLSAGPAAAQTLAESARQCVPTPFFGASGGYPLRIIQTATQITLISEENNRVHRIYLDRDFPEKLVPSYAGFSVGRWDGNTLVAETRGLRGVGGAPVPPDYRVVERLRRGADGLTLEQDILIDSAAYATSAQRSYRYFPRPDLGWQPAVCEEQPAPLAPRTAAR